MSVLETIFSTAGNPVPSCVSHAHTQLSTQLTNLHYNTASVSHLLNLPAIKCVVDETVIALLQPRVCVVECMAQFYFQTKFNFSLCRASERTRTMLAYYLRAIYDKIIRLRVTDGMAVCGRLLELSSSRFVERIVPFHAAWCSLNRRYSRKNETSRCLPIKTTAALVEHATNISSNIDVLSQVQSLICDLLKYKDATDNRLCTLNDLNRMCVRVFMDAMTDTRFNLQILH
jgi:hypothetical protein